MTNDAAWHRYSTKTCGGTPQPRGNFYIIPDGLQAGRMVAGARLAWDERKVRAPQDRVIGNTDRT